MLKTVSTVSPKISFKKESDLDQIGLQPERSRCSVQWKRAALMKTTRCWKEQPAVGIEALVGRIALWSKYNSEWVLLLGPVSSTSPVTCETLTPPPASPTPAVRRLSVHLSLFLSDLIALPNPHWISCLSLTCQSLNNTFPCFSRGSPPFFIWLHFKSFSVLEFPILRKMTHYSIGLSLDFYIFVFCFFKFVFSKWTWINLTFTRGQRFLRKCKEQLYHINYIIIQSLWCNRLFLSGYLFKLWSNMWQCFSKRRCVCRLSTKKVIFFYVLLSLEIP